MYVFRGIVDCEIVSWGRYLDGGEPGSNRCVIGHLPRTVRAKIKLYLGILNGLLYNNSSINHCIETELIL